MKNFKLTAAACYLGNFTQAIIINLIPILFIPLKEIFGLSITQLGIITLVNFLAQTLSDILFGPLVDRFGYRKFCIGASLLAICGFLIFILSPIIFANCVYTGMIIGTAIFSVAGGLLEVLLSPIISSLSQEHNCKSISFLHSFLAWGQASVVLITTLLVYFIGAQNWQIITSVWLIFPLSCLILFSFVPLNCTIPKEERQPIRSFIKNKYFLMLFVIIFTGGALEQIISQWGSAYLESGLGISKILGDILGIFGFAVMLALGRILYSKYCLKINLEKTMLYGMIISFLCFILIAISPNTALTVISCMIIGFSISLIVPGAVSIAGNLFSGAGVSLFGLLYFANDLGAALGPTGVTLISDNLEECKEIINLAENLGITSTQLSMRIGILCAAIIPLLGLILVTAIIKSNKDKKIIDYEQSQ